MSVRTTLSSLKCRLAFLLLALVVLTPVSKAAADNASTKTLLIINSYHEDELWANHMSRPVEMFLATVDSVVTDKVFLNNSSITDQATYDLMCDNVFKRYADNPPEYLVLVGNFAFTLRERIRQEWGDIPCLLISRIDTYGPTEQYFANTDDSDGFNVKDQKPLGSVRKDFNFSAVMVPDYYAQNINLMMRLIPDMKEFVFISDKAYINKVAAMNLESMLSEMYPDVRFRWLQGSEDNSEEMINTLIAPHPQVGILMSSWVYEMQNTRGINVLTTKDLSFLSAAVNPVFTMRRIYTSMGSLGGVFCDGDTITNNITRIVDAMIKGADMRSIPFYVPEEPAPTINYNLMVQFGLDLNRLPKNTVIVNRPQGYIEKYWMLMLLVLGIMVAGLLVVVLKNRAQRHKIAMLERHTGFINNLPMPYTKATLWFDDSGNVVNINYEMKNHAYEELISKNSLPDNPLHLFSNSYMSDIAHKLLSTSESVSVRHHFKRTGVYCYFIFVPFKRVSIDPNKKKKNAETAVASKLDIDVFAIDITKDHLMQQQLKDQAITIDISMEMAQLVPWQWDFENDTISFYTYRDNIGSSAATTRDGKSTSVMKFEEFLKLMPSAEAENFMKIHHSIMRGECSRLDIEFRMHRGENDVDYDWCENHGVVTDTDSDGRPLRMTGSIQFITDRKRQEEEMAQALTKAKESDMLKSAFLANMSHEIRTPLNAIVGFSNLLTTTNDMDERREFADIINRNNELLLSLINDILDLAKIESNTITLTYDLCDIHDVVDSISKTVSIRVPKGVKLNVVHYADSCIVKADAGHVSQILINLLTNATKFTKRGSITVGYEIYEDENKLYFYVKDTGIGINKENIDRVFNRFVKLNDFVQGSGLGLAICRTLVEKMGGEIGVESAGEGRGSMFWFTIPYNPMELKIEDKEVTPGILPAEHVVGEHADRPAKKEQPATSFEFCTPSGISNNMLATIPDGLTLLVAEDNPSNYWLMARLMQDKFKLHHAENGKIALDMVEEVKPDIIVMDINMPELDGYGAVEEMRKRGVTVPIIAVTAYAFASDRIRILNSGFDAFVSKPVSATILYDTITDVWERRNMKNDRAGE